MKNWINSLEKIDKVAFAIVGLLLLLVLLL